MKSENIIKVVEEGLKSKDQNLKRVRASATRSHFTIKALKAKVTNLEGRLDMMNGAYTALRVQNAEAIRERGNALYELTALKGELDIKARKTGTLPEDVESMRRALDTVRHDRDELDKTVTRLRDSIQFIQAQNETLKKERDRFEHEAREWKASTQCLLAQNETLKKEGKIDPLESDTFKLECAIENARKAGLTVHRVFLSEELYTNIYANHRQEIFKDIRVSTEADLNGWGLDVR